MSTGIDSPSAVLGVLADSAEPLSALQLSRACRLDKSVVNNCLYGLLKRGKACIIDASTTPPLWSATVASVGAAYQEEEKKLLGVIQSSGDHGASTFSIALKLSKQVNVVNQMLYALLDGGEVERIHQSPPAWRRTIKKDAIASKSTETISHPKKRPPASSESSESEDSSSKDNARPANQHCLVSAKSKLKPAVAPISHHHADPADKHKEGTWAKKCSDAVWKSISSYIHRHEIVTLLLDFSSRKLEIQTSRGCWQWDLSLPWQEGTTTVFITKIP